MKRHPIMVSNFDGLIFFATFLFLLRQDGEGWCFCFWRLYERMGDLSGFSWDIMSFFAELFSYLRIP